MPSAPIIATVPLLLALAQPGAAQTGPAQTGSTPAAGEPLVSEIVVAAPIAAVWDAYTNTETMRAWQVARMSPFELRPGARWRASYNADAPLDDADPTVIENELLAFDPGRMLAVRTVRAPADFPFPRAILAAWTVLYLEPVGESRTRVVTRMFGFTADEESQGMRAFFERGNAYELRQLAEHLARSASDR